MPPTPLSLRHNFSWTFLGNIFYAFSLWGILSVLTKMGSTATVGRFALASAIASPVIMFASLQLRSVLAADADNNHEFRDYLTVRLLLLPVAMLIILGIALRGYTPAQATAIMMFALARGVESVSDIFYGIAQKNDRMDVVAISKTIKGAVALLFFGVTFYLTRNLDQSLLALAISWALVLFLYDIPRVRRLNQALGGPPLACRMVKDKFRSIIWVTLPLGFVILLGQMSQTIPRAYLESSFGEDLVGIYAALSYLVIAGSTVVLALGQSSLARLSQHFAAGRIQQFKRLGLQLGLLGVVFGIGGVGVALFGGPYLLSRLYRPEYAEHAELFVLIMAAGGVIYVATLLAPMTTAMKAFRGQMVVQTVSAGILLLLATILIPRYGMTGAAWTVLGGGVGTALGFLFIIWAGLKRQAGRHKRWIDWLYQ